MSVLAMAVDKVRLEGICDISLKGITLTAYSTKLPQSVACAYTRAISPKLAQYPRD